jgi:hypothetical protein
MSGTFLDPFSFWPAFHFFALLVMNLAEPAGALQV